MKRIIFLLLCLFPFTAVAEDSLQVEQQSAQSEESPKRFWTAATEVTGLNCIVWGFDRYIMNEEFAKIGFKTIKQNFTKGFVWDNDQFSTNLFAHPYHGNLYFNSARNNGFNFWQSVPFAFGGSLMWEMFAENEPPSINDLMATSIGGSALGEMMYRLSDLVLDNSATGLERIGREFSALMICPVKGFNRIIRGDMWKYRSDQQTYHDFAKIPVEFRLGIGARYLANDRDLFRGETNLLVNFGTTYGSNYVTSKEPYDHFKVDIAIDFLGDQPLINKINLIGRLWGTRLKTDSDIEISAGLYQYFKYFDSESVLENSNRIPFKVSETASIGPGFVYSLPSINEQLKLRQSMYFGGILLGGSLSDYYKWINRNYNLGSGFSINSNTEIEYAGSLSFGLNLYYFRIFTWKGYEKKDLEHGNPLYLNVQGDKGDVLMAIINPSFNIALSRHLSLNIASFYYIRNSQYKFYPDITYNTFETQAGILFKF